MKLEKECPHCTNWCEDWMNWCPTCGENVMGYTLEGGQ